MATGPLRIALVGLGYWGPNLLRAAAEVEDLEISMLCDRDSDALTRSARRFTSPSLTSDFQDVLDDDSIDAVLIATPIHTHYELARQAIEADKHVFVEKPMTSTSAECQRLIALAKERDRVLMPGHVFLYSPAVVQIKEMLDRGDLGDLYFITSTRVNLGIHQSNASVIQDLAPHDLSILHYWIGAPEYVRAIARASVVPNVWDVAFLDLAFGNGTLVRVELSWLAPTKLRRTVLAGRDRMVVYDDTSNEQVRIFDCGVELVEPQNFGEHRLAYRLGNIVSPRVDTAEPLRLELEDFVNSIRSGSQPRSHMELGLDIVRMVEAAENSLRHNGAPVRVKAPASERRRNPDRRASLDGSSWFNPHPGEMQDALNGAGEHSQNGGPPVTDDDWVAAGR